MYTASSAFFEAIWDAGITHVFANLGSDHPALMEAMVTGHRTRPHRFPRIITCPNEMVALSMADGYARRTGRAQCVLVHVDVGTQALGQAVHNAAAGRTPVLIVAGLSPCTLEGELRGSRSEYIHWLQDVPDQRALVAQYCRYAGEVRRAANVKQLVGRALSFATSAPRGPAYLVAAREVLEEEIEPYTPDPAHWGAVELGGLPAKRVPEMAEALVCAEEPLVIVGYSGRNSGAVAALVELVEVVPGLRVLDAAGSDVCFPAEHPAFVGMRFGGVHPAVGTADVILVVDCDVPWIHTQHHPKPDAKIWHIDVDPLKQQMPVFYINALGRFRADAETGLRQITAHIGTHFRERLAGAEFAERRARMERVHAERLRQIEAEAVPGHDGSFNCAYLISQVKKACPADAIWAVEAITNMFAVADQVRPVEPGSWIHCGGGGLGWSGGGALGIKLASDTEAGGPNKGKFVCQIVGDGCYMFSVPSSVYWISQRYDIPVLTIVLNNRGWNAPRKSLLLVHPEGEGSKVSNEDLNISFAPTPDYSGIAKAASGGKAWAGYAGTADQLAKLLPQAVAAVKSGVTAVLDAQIDGIQGKYSVEAAAPFG